MNEDSKKIDSLPDEILLNILKYLPLNELVRSVSEVCTRWRTLSSDRKLWNGRVLDLPEDDTVGNIVELFPKYSSISLELSRHRWSGKAMFEAKRLHAVVRTKESFFSLLQVITRDCDYITDISICGVNKNYEQVLKLISYCSNLEKLSIDGSFSFENTGIRHLVTSCPLLTDVDTGEVSFTDTELKFFLEKKGPQLTHLGMSIQTSKGSVLPKFLHVCCETLTSLDIHGIAGFFLTVVDDLTVFGAMKKLEQLQIHSLIKFSDGVLANAFRSRWFENLKVLVMDNAIYVDDEVMTAISLNCPQLYELQINNSKFNGMGLHYLHHMKNLKKLDLSFSQFTRTFGALYKCTQLTELSVESCTLVSPQELAERIPCLRELRRLDLTHCRVYNLQLQDLPKHMPFLSVLGVYHTPAIAQRIDILRKTAPHIRIVV